MKALRLQGWAIVEASGAVAKNLCNTPRIFLEKPPRDYLDKGQRIVPIRISITPAKRAAKRGRK